MTDSQDRTLILLKPDALERDLVGEILRRIEAAGMTIERLETVDADRSLIEAHYADHSEKDWYPALVDWMTDRVIAGVVTGDGAARRMRALAGDTEPASANPGTIRGDLGDDSYDRADSEGRALQNLVHAAEPEAAEEELALWFDT